MKQNNPRFILRNHIAHRAIELAEKGDFSEVHRVLKLLESPYSLTVDINLLQEPPSDPIRSSAEALSPDNYDASAMNRYFSKPPEWALNLCVT